MRNSSLRCAKTCRDSAKGGMWCQNFNGRRCQYYPEHTFCSRWILRSSSLFRDWRVFGNIHDVSIASHHLESPLTTNRPPIPAAGHQVPSSTRTFSDFRVSPWSARREIYLNEISMFSMKSISFHLKACSSGVAVWGATNLPLAEQSSSIMSWCCTHTHTHTHTRENSVAVAWFVGLRRRVSRVIVTHIFL